MSGLAWLQAAADGGTSSWQVLAVVLAALGELLAVVFVYRVLVRGGSPSSTLLWVFLILAAPWFGLFCYYLFPRRLQLRRLRTLQGRSARRRPDRPPRDGRGRNPEGPSRLSGLHALLGGDDGRGLPDGNVVEWLPSGDDFLAAAEAAIGAAQHHVHCVLYIFRPDAAGRRFLELLIAAAKRGVRVRLVYDSFGSLSLKSAHLEPLRQAGGQAFAFLPLLWKRRPFTVNLRNHRKLVIVDGVVGFTGGRNVGDEYFPDRVGRTRRWCDAMVGVRGPVVERLQDVFVEDWHTASDEGLVLDPAPQPPPPATATRVAVVCSGPDREQSDLWFAVIQAIGEARQSIELSSPYLVPPPTLAFALELAAARGVAVRIHTNGSKAESPILYHAQRSYYRGLLEAGVEICETVEDYNHAKVLVVDGRHVIVGSANMDLRSANLNFEIAVAAVDAPELARQVLATIEERRARARSLTLADLPRQPWWRAIDGLAGLLSPVL